MWAVAADAAVLARLHRIEWVQILWKDPGLHHVAGFAVAGVQRGDRHDRLAIKGARPFMQHVALGHGRSPSSAYSGASYAASNRPDLTQIPQVRDQFSSTTPPTEGCAIPSPQRQ